MPVLSADRETHLSPVEVARYYQDRIPGLKQTSTTEWRGGCPVHGGTDPNFAVTSETGQWFCHSQCNRGGSIYDLEMALSDCDFQTAKRTVCELAGRSTGTPVQAQRRLIVATYDYADEQEQVLFQVVRYRPKSFNQRRPHGDHWIYGITEGLYRQGDDGNWYRPKDATGTHFPAVRLVLYRLPNILKATTVYVAEGEEDVQTLVGWRLDATCNPMGAGKWRPEYAECLRGMHIIILPDNDGPGRAHALEVAKSLLGVAASVKIVELPGLPHKGDVRDWKNAGGTADGLAVLVGQAVHLDQGAVGKLEARWCPAADTGAEATSEWPTPIPIHGSLPPVEPFCEDLLPPSFRPWILDIADRMQIPPDCPAAATVVSIAGSVNRRASIQPKAQDSSWVVVPNLWGAVVAPPGFLKSPILHAATAPLHKIDTGWAREFEVSLKQHNALEEEWNLRQAAWKEQFKQAVKKGGAPPARPGEALVAPGLPRLIANDSTFEALHEILAQNPAGILVLRDELTGWLSTLDRAGREGERAFFLEAWNGDTGFTIDRIGRGTIRVEACCVSMLGGIQPARLRSYLAGALEDGPTNDGLIQRFQIVVWPDFSSDWRLVDRPPDERAGERCAGIFGKLVGMPVDSPLRMRFSPDAQELFYDWLTALEAKVRANDLHPALISHLAKYRSLMPTLALLFELTAWATGSSDLGAVSLEHARLAAAWCDYLESHARRVYSCVVTPQIHAARALGEKIKAGKLGMSFSCRQVYLKGWTGLDTAEVVRAAAEVLEDAGWVRAQRTQAKSIGGRPSDAYDVNPAVWR